MVSGARVSQLINNLQKLAATALSELKAFFSDRKVTLMKNYSRHLPRASGETNAPDTRLHERSSAKAGDIPRVFHPEKSEETQRKELYKSYSPKGDAFQRAMRRAGIQNHNQISNEVMANYADRINKYRGELSCQQLKDMLPNDLMILVIEHQQQVRNSERQSVEPETVSRSRRPAMNKRPSKSVTAKPRQTKTASIQLKPFDTELPQHVAAFNWLHVNRRQTGINFNQAGREMLAQATAAKQKYAGAGERPSHLANMVHSYCQQKNWSGLQSYLHNLRDNQMTIFSPEIMRGLNILLFQESLCNSLRDRMPLSGSDDRVVYQQVLQAAQAGSWGEVATLCSLYEGELIPPRVLQPLEAVIPGFSVNLPKRAESARVTAPAKPPEYRSPVSQLTRMERSIPPELSTQEIGVRVVWPKQEQLGYDGRGALLTLQTGLSRKDHHLVSSGVTYLKEDQGVSVVDAGTYRAIRYMELKQVVQQHFNALVAASDSDEQQDLLNRAIGLVDSDSWSELVNLDQN